jgi:mono/diheme cytochrome c family protein
MPRSITIAATTFAVVLLASIAMRVTVSAQAGQAGGRGGGGGAQAAPAPDQKMIQVKTTQRVYDKKQLLSAPALSAEAYTGRVLWQQRCAYCHDGVGQPSYKTMGPWLDSDTVKEEGADGVKAATNAGSMRMPAFKYDLSAEQLNDVIEFLKTVSPSEKPTDAQLAGKAPALDGND